MDYDVVIIGAGIVGCALAHKLSRYDVSICVLERDEDVCNGSTKANSAIVHAGYDPPPFSLMARLNTRGNELTGSMCASYKVPFARIGALVLAFDDNDLVHIKKLYERGRQNGVTGLELWNPADIRHNEPNVNSDALGALYAKTSGIVETWGFGAALMEDAVINGVTLKLKSGVTGISRTEQGFSVHTGSETIEAGCVINAAGTASGEVSDMVIPPYFNIIHNKGQYYVLDKSQGSFTKRTLFQCPTKHGKGVLISPTVHGNLLVGPDASDIRSERDRSTSAEGLSYVLETARRTAKNVPIHDTIRTFAGVRANSDRDDFIIDEPVHGFVNVAGIKSPGLTCAPAIAEYVTEIVGQRMTLTEKKQLVPYVPRPVWRELTVSEKNDLIRQNPLYGRVVCRCETVTQGEIEDCLCSAVPALSADVVKRRTRAGMGRCQGGFCYPRILGILERGERS